MSLEAKGINTTHLVSVFTDGASNMRGAQKGFVNLLQMSLDRELMTFHCILHQEVLSTQTFPPECVEVMSLIIKILNKIIVKPVLFTVRRSRLHIFRFDAAQQSALAVQGRGAQTVHFLSGACDNLLGKQRPQLS